ncbi:MAG: hypothetical protein JWM18_2760 [Chloroflexi bacterium]|jgi:hypothetical protein|nr:hypothetical protein [Chloroflexota bacterium]
MKLRIEEDPTSCGRVDPCPKILSIEGDDEWLFVQGKRPGPEEMALFHLPDDENVVKYPRRSMRNWAANQHRVTEP